MATQSSPSPAPSSTGARYKRLRTVVVPPIGRGERSTSAGGGTFVHARPVARRARLAIEEEQLTNHVEETVVGRTLRQIDGDHVVVDVDRVDPTVLEQPPCELVGRTVVVDRLILRVALMPHARERPID